MERSSNAHLLSYQETIRVLSSYDLPLATGYVAKSPSEAFAAAERIGYPVTLKAISPQITHKTEAAAVILGLASGEQVKSAYNDVIKNATRYNPKAEIQGVLVQETIRDGVEVLVGVSRDRQFGPVIVFGIGGVLVEVFQDISMRLPPITSLDAEEMIREIRGYRLLEGFRGRPRSDVGAIVDILLKVSIMTVDMKGKISEMDLNPIFVKAEGLGAKVVDARIFVLPSTQN